MDRHGTRGPQLDDGLWVEVGGRQSLRIDYYYRGSGKRSVGSLAKMAETNKCTTLLDAYQRRIGRWN